MAIAKELEQWSFWSLLRSIFSVKAERDVIWSEELRAALEDLLTRTIKTAREITLARELEIVARKPHPAGFVSIQVCACVNGIYNGEWWWVDIFPAHIEMGWRGPVFDLRVATHIKFKFSEHPVTTDMMNPSSYLIIESMR